MIELYILLVLMIVGAIVAIELKDLLSAVISTGAVGLVLSIVFLIIKAPDLAITQIVVEMLCFIILLRVILKKDPPFSTTGSWLFNTFVTAGFIAMFLFVAVNAFKDLPEFGYPIMRVANIYLKEGLVKTGASNLVSSIILDFRAYDTLGEATILFTAVIGVLTIVRRIGRKKKDEIVEEDDE